MWRRSDDHRDTESRRTMDESEEHKRRRNTEWEKQTRMNGGRKQVPDQAEG